MVTTVFGGSRQLKYFYHIPSGSRLAWTRQGNDVDGDLCGLLPCGTGMSNSKNFSKILYIWRYRIACPLSSVLVTTRIFRSEMPKNGKCRGTRFGGLRFRWHGLATVNTSRAARVATAFSRCAERRVCCLDCFRCHMARRRTTLQGLLFRTRSRSCRKMAILGALSPTQSRAFKDMLGYRGSACSLRSAAVLPYISNPCMTAVIK